MKSNILGVIGVLWGGAMIARALATGVPAPTSSYGMGAFVALLFGTALFAAGAKTLFMRRRRSDDF